MLWHTAVSTVCVYQSSKILNLLFSLLLLFANNLFKEFNLRVIVMKFDYFTISMNDVFCYLIVLGMITKLATI